MSETQTPLEARLREMAQSPYYATARRDLLAAADELVALTQLRAEVARGVDWRSELREAAGRIEELLCAFADRSSIREPEWITQSTREAAFDTARLDAQQFRALLGEDGAWTDSLVLTTEVGARNRDDIRVLLSEARDRSTDPIAIEMIDEAVALLPRTTTGDSDNG
jgi:hypothetical protein